MSEDTVQVSLVVNGERVTRTVPVRQHLVDFLRTDLGLTGPTDGIIGVERQLIIQRFMTQMPIKFETAKGPAALHGVVITLDPETGRATGIQRLRVPA